MADSARSSSKVVQQSTHDQKFEGSNPISAGTRRDKINKKHDLLTQPAALAKL